eukprot:4105233-Pleurochrysis_carterae.AAC.1
MYHNDGAETGQLICAVRSTYAPPICSQIRGAHRAHGDVRQAQRALICALSRAGRLILRTRR